VHCKRREGGVGKMGVLITGSVKQVETLEGLVACDDYPAGAIGVT